jgi:magnesium transporter
MGQARTRVFRKGTLEAEGFPVANVSEYLEEPDTLVWEAVA